MVVFKHVALEAAAGGEVFGAVCHRTACPQGAGVLLMLLGVDVQAAACGKLGITAFCMALEGLGAQMCDTVTLKVLGAGEGLSTALLCADKTTVVIMFPFVSEQL